MLSRSPQRNAAALKQLTQCCRCSKLGAEGEFSRRADGFNESPQRNAAAHEQLTHRGRCWKLAAEQGIFPERRWVLKKARSKQWNVNCLEMAT